MRGWRYHPFLCDPHHLLFHRPSDWIEATGKFKAIAIIPSQSSPEKPMRKKSRCRCRDCQRILLIFKLKKKCTHTQPNSWHWYQVRVMCETQKLRQDTNSRRGKEEEGKKRERCQVVDWSAFFLTEKPKKPNPRRTIYLHSRLAGPGKTHSRHGQEK